MYKEGKVLLGDEKYDNDYNNIKAHLTNAYLKEKNEMYEEGYKKDRSEIFLSFSAFFNDLQNAGVDTDLLWNKIYDIIINTLISIEPENCSFFKTSPQTNQN